MGLTGSSSGLNLLKENFNIDIDINLPVIALAGNPNTGKSTVFNGLTGLRQHTGNWPGKTVTQAQGLFTHKEQDFILVDLPGTYSLLSNSTEEMIARNFICFAEPDAVIVVADATNLERNLNLSLQVMELTDKVILCVNLMDEAKRKNIKINIDKLKGELRIPVIPAVARDEIGLEQLKEMSYQISKGLLKFNPLKLNYSITVENAVEKIVPVLERNICHLKAISYRWLALRLIEGDRSILESVMKYHSVKQENTCQIKERGVQTDGVS